MIFRSSNPISPSVDITFNGVAVDYLSIQKVTLELAEGQHDLARVVIAGVPPKAITEYGGAQVQIIWGQNSSRQAFHGYVAYVEPMHVNNQGLVNKNQFQMGTIYCFGASYDMKAKANKVWDEPTLVDIVRDIANKYRYTFSIPNNTTRLTRVVQSYESDWELLTRLSNQFGYSMTVSGTHIHMYDRHKAMSRRISYNQLQTPISQRMDTPLPGFILNMTGSFGQVTPTTTANYETVSVLGNDGVVVSLDPVESFSQTGQAIPPRFTDDVATNVSSPDLARQILETRARNRYAYKATVELTGTLGIKPGGIVNISNLKTKFDGFWYVTSVVHTLTLDKFFTTVEIIKDSTNDEPASYTPVATALEVQDPVLSSGFWQSPIQLEDIYG